eukprot:924923-Pyramimonas_sp.AAC.1
MAQRANICRSTSQSSGWRSLKLAPSASNGIHMRIVLDAELVTSSRWTPHCIAREECDGSRIVATLLAFRV